MAHWSAPEELYFTTTPSKSPDDVRVVAPKVAVPLLMVPVTYTLPAASMQVALHLSPVPLPPLATAVQVWALADPEARISITARAKEVQFRLKEEK
jgi:hypothetical protein